MKNSLLMLAVLVAAVAAWIVAFPNKNPIKKVFAKPSTGGGATVPSSITPAQPVNAIKTGRSYPGSFVPQIPVDSSGKVGFPLMQGSTGQYVRNVQRALNERYGSTLVVDGIFGPKTYKALSSHNFNADALNYQEYLILLGLDG